MSVISRIEKSGAIIDIWMSLATGCRIIFRGDDRIPNHTVHEDNEPINAVYRSVIDFIKWYNENKPSTE